MRRLTRVRPLAAILLFPVTTAALALAAHSADDPTPLAGWAAPPYWVQPAEPAARSLETKGPEALAVASLPLPFHAVTPCRVADTRGNGFTGGYGPPSLMAGTVRTFLVTSPNTSCGIPSTAVGVSFNFAAVLPTANGNLVAYPAGGAPPTVSSLNWTPSEIAISNAAVVPLGTGGGLSVLVNGPGGSTTHLVIDVNGYFAADPLVYSVNGLSGDVTLGHDANVTVGVAGQTITIGTDAASANTPSTIVRRDASGNFSAGTITGSVAGAASANLLKAGDTMTGNLVFNGGDIDLYDRKIIRASYLYLHSTPDLTNTFLGGNAGNLTVTGLYNTGLGAAALGAIAGGQYNTAVGDGAGSVIDAGSYNVTVGDAAGNAITGGFYNVAVGAGALKDGGAGIGQANVAVGAGACLGCTSSGNVALGANALANVTGGANVAVGTNAGQLAGSGSNDIYIGNVGAAESATIRIGNAQTAAFMAGISGATAASGVTVLVSPQGKLGTVVSSVRFKDDVRDMGAESDLVQRLRPVVFRYKPEIDPDGVQEFGLIAEEVERIRPDLVVCGADGQPATIRYHELVPMLVNEVQKDRRELADLKARLARIEARLEAGNEHNGLQ